MGAKYTDSNAAVPTPCPSSPEMGYDRCQRYLTTNEAQGCKTTTHTFQCASPYQSIDTCNSASMSSYTSSTCMECMESDCTPGDDMIAAASKSTGYLAASIGIVMTLYILVRVA